MHVHSQPPELLSLARLAAVRRTGLLDSLPEESFDRITRLAARLLGVPVSVISLVDTDRQFVKSSVGLPEPWATCREMPIAYSYCQHALGVADPLVIPDARVHSLVRGSPAVTENGSLAYVGVPLQSEGHAVGTLCVVDSRPREWTEDEIGTLRDLAAAVQTEIDLRRAVAVAENASRAKSDFLSRMSHELRTPLNSIIGFSTVLSRNTRRNLSAREVDFAERIRANGDHLLGLIDDILDLAKVEAGKHQVVVEPTPLEPLVRRTLAALEGELEGRAIELACIVPAELDPIETDAARLKQILINLVGNAIKFTDEGSVTLRVHAEGRQVRAIEVTDTGIGIPPDRLDAVFDVFEQAEPTTGGRFGGTGLGLAISRQLCHMLGYDLTVESVLGEGTTFTVDLLRGPNPPRPLPSPAEDAAPHPAR